MIYSLLQALKNCPWELNEHRFRLLGAACLLSVVASSCTQESESPLAEGSQPTVGLQATQSKEVKDLVPRADGCEPSRRSINFQGRDVLLDESGLFGPGMLRDEIQIAGGGRPTKVLWVFAVDGDTPVTLTARSGEGEAILWAAGSGEVADQLVERLRLRTLPPDLGRGSADRRVSHLPTSLMVESPGIIRVEAEVEGESPAAFCLEFV